MDMPPHARAVPFGRGHRFAAYPRCSLDNMRMPREELRFGIAAVGGFRAATWKLWTEGADEKVELYLACRALGGHLKTSLHASGKWRTAYTPGTFESAVKDLLPEGSDRVLVRWPRPAPMLPASCWHSGS
jgi:hypothetical protein